MTATGAHTVAIDVGTTFTTPAICRDGGVEVVTSTASQAAEIRRASIPPTVCGRHRTARLRPIG